MNLMVQCLGEFLGVMLLMYIGDGVVTNHILTGSGGKGLGVSGIDICWGVAVALPAYIFMSVSGGWLNPAVTIAGVVRGSLSLATAGCFIVAQVLGAFVGSTLVFWTFREQFKAERDKGAKLNCFTTRAPLRNNFSNFVTELIGTFFLAFFVFCITCKAELSQLSMACMIGLLVTGLAYGMGGPTGASLNPARDLGPRIAHWLLPVPDKGSSEWDYGWIPVTAQVCAGILAGLAFNLLGPILF